MFLKLVTENFKMMQVGFSGKDIVFHKWKEEEVPLSGFIFRMEQPSSGPEEGALPLSVRVAAFRDREDQLLLISLDALGVGEEETKLLKNEAKKRFRKEEKVTIHIVATHTHSAPALMPLRKCGRVVPAWIEAVRVALGEALDELKWTQLDSIGLIKRRIPDVQYCRRRILQDGTVFKAPEIPPGVLVADPGVPPDETMTVLTFRDSDHRCLGSFVHFSCHATCCNSLHCSVDIVGQLREYVAQQVGGIGVFLQGCAGDVNPTRIGLSSQEQLSNFFEEKWRPHLRSLEQDELKLPPVVQWSKDEHFLDVHYNVGAFPSEAELVELESASKGGLISVNVASRLKNIMNMGPNADVERIKFASAALAESVRQSISADPSSTTTTRMPMAFFKFGEKLKLALVGSEPFQETHRKLISEDAILLGGYLSPCRGYMPPRSALVQGGYEVDDAWRFYCHPFPFEENSEARMVQQIREFFPTFL